VWPEEGAGGLAHPAPGSATAVTEYRKTKRDKSTIHTHNSNTSTRSIAYKYTTGTDRHATVTAGYNLIHVIFTKRSTVWD